MIEASFLSQYGLRLREIDMTWNEFTMCMSGLTSETPLGLMVSIRAEDDPDRLKGFNKDQLEIRSEWRSKVNRRMFTATQYDKDKIMKEFQSMIVGAFGGDGNGR